MSMPLQIFAVLALLPAAANPSLLVRGEALALSLCGGSASVSIPLDSPLPGTTGSACCAKGCQSGEKRKRAARGSN